MSAASSNLKQKDPANKEVENLLLWLVRFANKCWQFPSNTIGLRGGAAVTSVSFTLGLGF